MDPKKVPNIKFSLRPTRRGAFIIWRDCGTIMAVKPGRDKKDRPPYDAGALEQAALAYAARYATTRAKLLFYLKRKLAERGWAGAGAPPLDTLVERMAAAGYVDDAAFAAGRAAALGRRGYGERRVAAALAAAGIAPDDAAEARETARGGAWAAALRFAERRRIGPFAAAEPGRAEREKALAAMLRAGHPLDLSRRLIGARPGEIPQPDEN
jgi:regulatory protein